MEETITFNLIERVQFPLNATVYRPGGIPLPDPSLSLLDWILRSTEVLHSQVRRYQSPDEHPFFPSALAPALLPPLAYPAILHANTVNVNPALKAAYVSAILPAVCPAPARPERPEAQENYGSAAVADVTVLQALSRRVHFGKFVAEAKFRAETARFVALIRAGDRRGIDEAITDAAVEKKVLDRLGLKARTYGTDPATADEAAGKIRWEAVVAMYKVRIVVLSGREPADGCSGLCDSVDKGGRGRVSDAEAGGD